MERKVACRLRDGVTLYADIYRPVGGGNCPVLLMRQLYGRAIASTVTSAHPVWYAHHGYMVVVQDVRGRGESEGEIDPFLQEVEDGYDAVEWAAGLPGSNGRVGMYGFSYQGSVQWAAAVAKPPHLVAIAPGMCAADLYHGRFYPHGRFAWGAQLTWAFQFSRDGANRRGDEEAAALCEKMMRNTGDLLWKLPLAEKHPVLEKYCPFFYEWLEHPEYDKFWEKRNWIPALAESSVPALQIGGWYDPFLGATLQTYEALSGQPRHDGHYHRLLIGPWGHIPWGRMAGGVNHGPEADGDVHREQLRWFDYWLKEKRDVDLYREPAVRYYELESKQWKTAERFGAKTSKSFYISGSPKPANGPFGGRLLQSAAEVANFEAADVFVYDARLPMPMANYMPTDRSQQQDRYEILVYTSEPLAEPLHAAGAPRVTVHAQTLNGPTDLVATLTVLMPDGKARFLSIGRAEVGSENAEGGKDWQRIDIPMRPFAVEFAAGACIRLELTGSAFPLFARHLNGISGAELHTAGPGKQSIATVAVCSKPGLVSYLELPVT